MKAIDNHCHPSTQPFADTFGPYLKALEKYWKSSFRVRTEEEMVREIVEADAKALVVALDAETATGLPKTSNDYVASLVKKYPEAFAGAWGSVDPWKGKKAVKEAERAIKELGLLGLKFHPTIQQFYPNDPRFYPLWGKMEEMGSAVQVHLGTTGMGAGTPGGMGEKLKYTAPIPYLDDVAGDFPGLTIIGLHPAFPWTDEMTAITIHKSNVFWDLSGWAPKYLPASLKKDINSRLQDKVVFGTDYPSISFTRLFEEWEAEGYKKEVLEKLYYKNIRRILRLPELGK